MVMVSCPTAGYSCSGGLGLDHFEGRSWIGWHRHVTLAATAQLFLTQLRLTDPKAAGQS
jgi:SRSO17 transposase